MIDQILGGQEGSRLDTTLDSRDGEGGLDKSRELQLKQKGRDRESQRMHLREHRELLQSRKNFDNLILTQHLDKALSARYDYTSEDAPHSEFNDTLCRRLSN